MFLAVAILLELQILHKDGHDRRLCIWFAHLLQLLTEKAMNAAGAYNGENLGFPNLFQVGIDSMDQNILVSHGRSELYAPEMHGAVRALHKQHTITQYFTYRESKYSIPFPNVRWGFKRQG